MLAGLLRPEGWALELAYLAYRWPDLDAAGRARLGALLAAAPLLWAGMDLWATGDALHSLHGTQALGEALDRPRSTHSALRLAPGALRDVIQLPLLWVTLAGACAGLLLRDRASALPGAIVILGLAGYLVLGVAGLPLLGRYLLLPATMLMIKALGVLLLAALAIGAATGVSGTAGGYSAPSPKGKPKLKLKVKSKQTIKTARKQGVKVTATCSVPCIVSVKARAHKTASPAKRQRGGSEPHVLNLWEPAGSTSNARPRTIPQPYCGAMRR